MEAMDKIAKDLEDATRQRERERSVYLKKNYRSIAKFSFFTKIIHLNKNHTLQLSIKN